jgi:hypothetical protein
MLGKAVELPLKFLEEVGVCSEVEKALSHCALTLQDA